MQRLENVGGRKCEECDVKKDFCFYMDGNDYENGPERAEVHGTGTLGKERETGRERERERESRGTTPGDV